MSRDDVLDEIGGSELPQRDLLRGLALGDRASQLVQQGVQLHPPLLRGFGDTQLATAAEIDTMPLQHGGAGGMFEHQACDGLAGIRRLEEGRASLCHEVLLSTHRASRHPKTSGAFAASGSAESPWTRSRAGHRMEHVERPSETCSVCGLVPLAPRLRGATHVVARSQAMQVLLKRAARFAQSDAPIAILGETGTGKEVVARVVHANSPRAQRPFVAVNVAALPTELLESELFGHGKGAFTGAAVARRGLFEEADGGTLFLDEIGEMSLPLQAKVLRALQDGELRRVGENQSFSVDVRVVCATHRNLRERVASGQFREDLFYRLKVLALEVPPLRERQEDILPLARHFLTQENTSAIGFAPSAAERMLRYPWHGNVRELENVVKHGAALASGQEIVIADLPEELLTDRPAPSSRAAPTTPFRTLAEVEREHILRVLDACGGSQSEAARVLGVARNTLWRKLRSPEPAA